VKVLSVQPCGFTVEMKPGVFRLRMGLEWVENIVEGFKGLKV
jgi:hypothetical protein